GRQKFSLMVALAFPVGGVVVGVGGGGGGQALSLSQIEELTGSDLFRRCHQIALHYLSYRPRSQWEVRQRLRRHGFEDEIVDGVLSKLRQQGQVDDTVFAQTWRRDREAFSPRGRRLLEFELRRRGVAAEIVDEVTSGLDDDASAYQAAQRKLGTWAKLDYQGFRRRMVAYLQRRGFDYGAINRTVARLWQEREVDPAAHH
ncbi:MAG: regulatory protein RecX, partial [Dehalococcoidia bacterium]